MSRLMSELQCAYLLGRNPALPLGGTDCHVYLEFRCGSVDKQRLQRAWQDTCSAHRMLQCRFCRNGLMEECSGQEFSERLDRSFSFEDLSDSAECSRTKRLAALRDALSHRIPDTEHELPCALKLVRISDSEHLLLFDWSLIAGDVPSFQAVLSQLAARYAGGTAVCPDIVPITAQRTVRKRSEKKKAMQILSSELINYETKFPLRLVRAPEEMHGARYHAEDRMLERDAWTALQLYASEHDIPAEALLLYAFSEAMSYMLQETDFLLNIPVFLRTEAERECVGDLTDIMLFPVHLEHPGELSAEDMENIIDEYLKQLLLTAYDGQNVRKQLSALHPENRWIAPVVFSPCIGRPLVSKQFTECFGPIAYMISQTPQVWIDAQSFAYNDQLLISLVFPSGMLGDETEHALSDRYLSNLQKMAEILAAMKGAASA